MKIIIHVISIEEKYKQDTCMAECNITPIYSPNHLDTPYNQANNYYYKLCDPYDS